MIEEDIRKRILLLDGATGTMLQRGFDIARIHRMYIDAGADIIETNTFTIKGYEDTFANASIARKVADEANAELAGSGRTIYVAGVLGPYSKMLSMSDDTQRPESRAVSFDALADIYRENASALMDAGADTILIETVFDALNAKAALYALEKLFEERGKRLPLMVSATINDKEGRLLTGMQIRAFYYAISHAPLMSFGINCSFGAEDMAPIIREVASHVSCAVSMHPNAGLPNEFGQYEETPQKMAEVIATLAKEGCLNIAGGCCGTTPAHISALKEALEGIAPHKIKASGSSALKVSGLEPVRVDLETTNFVNVGERTNVAGSRKFARLIGEKQYEEAAAIARKQIEEGADIIDINMDDSMLDSRTEMETFVRYISNDPYIAKAAFMIDSSDWETILAGIKNAPGRCIVNSISLKEGEEEFLRKAREIRILGAAVIVMAFDEQGQATTFDRKIEICGRAYKLLVEKAGFKPTDIIFDVNILTIGTGIAEHDNYAMDFIRAVRWIKENLPGCHTSGGVSNLSFAFRGNNPVREAMHSVFLFHAIKAGLDMAIVNPGMLQIYSEIEPGLRKAAEDVVLNTDGGATERLTEYAQKLKAAAEAADPSLNSQQNVASWRQSSLDERLSFALVHGDSTFLQADIEEALASRDAVSIIEGPLLKGMEKVGELFGGGQMFLPQVIKSARVMRTAVDILQPFISTGASGRSRKKMVLATAKGDVHDIGKNILAVVLSCSDIEVIDLGVMVDNEVIMETVRREKPDFVGISGLITPSLSYMEDLCRLMAAEGLRTPLFVGGATASALHTAVKLAPLYDRVVYTSGASACSNMVGRLIREGDSAFGQIHAEQQNLRNLRASSGEQFASLEEARKLAVKYPVSSFVQPESFARNNIEIKSLDLGRLVEYIDWTMFLSFWGFKGKPMEEMVETEPKAAECHEEGMMALSRMILGRDVEVGVVARFYDAYSENEDIVLPEKNIRFGVGRSTSRSTSFASLADFFPTSDSGLTSRVGVFAVSVRDNAPHCCDAGCNDYTHLMRRSLCARLAEAASEWLQAEMIDACGGENSPVKVIRPAFGYASCSDHSLKEPALKLLDAERLIGIKLTESYAMIPETSLCGLVVAHPEAKYPDIRNKQ